MATIEINKELEEIYDKIEETGKTAPDKKDKETKEYLKGIRGRSWFLTINEKAFTDIINYPNMEQYLKDIFGVNLNYACWDLEKGDTGNVHMHIYIELKNPITFLNICNKFKGAHVEKRRGNPTETRTYILKPEGVKFKGKEKNHTVIQEFREIGNWDLYKNIVARGDVVAKKSINERIEDLINQYDNIDDIIKADPNLYNTHYKVIDVLLEQKLEQKFKEEHCTVTIADNGEEVIRVNLNVCYLYGGAGVGKTTGVYHKYGLKNVFKTSFVQRGQEYGLLFDEYKGQGVLMIDEVSPYCLPSIQYINNLLDVSNHSKLSARYRDKLKLVHTIIFVSNYPFEALYRDLQLSSENKDAYEGFYRRFTGGIWEMQREGDEACIINKIDLSKLSERNIKNLKEFSPVTKKVKVIGYKEYNEMNKKNSPFCENDELEILELPF